MFIFRLIIIKRVNQVLIQNLIFLGNNRCRIHLLSLDISQRVLRVPTFLSIIIFLDLLNCFLLLIHLCKIEFCVISQWARDQSINLIIWKLQFSTIIIVLLINCNKFTRHVKLAFLQKINLYLWILSYFLLIFLYDALINFIQDRWCQIDWASQDLWDLGWFNTFL